MSTVLVKTTVPSTTDQAITAAIASLKKSLPFLVNLSKTDRKAVAKPSAKAQTFIKQALDVALQNPTMLPASFDIHEMQQDMQLFEYLASLELRLRQVLQEVDDTLKQVGTQNYAAARLIYASASSQFAGPPLQLAADQLGRHFGRKPKTRPAVNNGNGAGNSASPAPASPVHALPAPGAPASAPPASPPAASTAPTTSRG